MRPPGPSRPRESASRSIGAHQNPREFTARMASNGPSRVGGSRSTVPSASATRPAWMTTELHLLACRTITSERSMP